MFFASTELGHNFHDNPLRFLGYHHTPTVELLGEVSYHLKNLAVDVLWHE